MIETVDTIDIKQLLGKRIKELRIQRGYTQEYLSEQIGIGQSNLSKVECGTNFVTAETLSKLLLTLDVNANDLFDFKHKQNKDILKEEILSAIINKTVNIELLYKLYSVIK